MRVIKTVGLLGSAFLALSFSTVASAEVFSLSSTGVTGGAVTISSIGTVNLSQNFSVDCAVSITGNVDGSPGSAALGSVGRTISGAFPCGVVPFVYPIDTWSVTAIDDVAQTVDVYIAANTLSNLPCGSVISVTLDSNLYIDLNNVEIKAKTLGDPSCYVTGVLEVSQALFILP